MVGQKPKHSAISDRVCTCVCHHLILDCADSTSRSPVQSLRQTQVRVRDIGGYFRAT